MELCSQQPAVVTDVMYLQVHVSSYRPAIAISDRAVEIILQEQFNSVQSLNRVGLFATPWTAACQASLSITNSRSLHKLMCIKSMTQSNHLILCCPLLLLPSILPSISVFSNELVLCIRGPKYWNFSFSISHSNEHLGL